MSELSPNRFLHSDKEEAHMSDSKDMLSQIEEVTLRRIEEVIDEGYDTVSDVKRITRAGMGLAKA